MAGERFLEGFASVFPRAFSEDEPLVIDGKRLEALIELLEDLAVPDIECVMVASEGIPPLTYSGIAGFRKAWTEWLEGFERVRFQLEDVLEGDRAVVTLARQIGTTRYGVELEQPSAMVSVFGEGGELERVEFHLDRERALHSAGLDPDEAA